MIKFVKCTHCGNVVEYINDAGVPVMCCGEKMKELVANTTDAATEKHVPVATLNGNVLHVEVGSVMHPMTEAHSILFVILVTDKSVRRVNFEPTDVPVATFNIEGEKPLKVYVFCNLHGLWVKEL